MNSFPFSDLSGRISAIVKLLHIHDFCFVAELPMVLCQNELYSETLFFRMPYAYN